ncbi:hypothetical protein [Kitasatospora mediocidica]|uniref:hypothetical protein n=1 Tax=Kitasatospora mediocidica TaxID=58352 RepID=UPI000AF1ADAA|nr:hypothetical protein [Kitasatospora mediocidica]
MPQKNTTGTGPAWSEGDTAYDPGTLRVGVVQQIDCLNGRPHQVWLRPAMGGREWTAFAWELQAPPTKQSATGGHRDHRGQAQGS